MCQIYKVKNGMKKYFLIFGIATFFSLNVLAQNITSAQWLSAVDEKLKKNPKLVQAASAKFSIATYGTCLNVGLEVIKGDVYGQQYKPETLFVAAHLIQLTAAYRNQAMLKGTPAAVFENSFKVRTLNSQAAFNQELVTCTGILNNIYEAAQYL
jgi:hypothetical protein